jgi:transketolase
LRATPGLNVMRPADANETAECWAVAVQHDGPSLFALTRQHVPHLDRSRMKGEVSNGAYILSEAEGGEPDVILMGSGSEVSLCAKAQEKLKKDYGVKARVISMPSWYLFQKQDEAYRESILPKNQKKRVTVEAASTYGWERWAGDQGIMIGVDHYGASAPGDEIMKHFGFTAEHVTAEALRLLGRNEEADREYGGETTNVAPTSPQEGHS